MPEPLLDQQQQLRIITDIAKAATDLQIDLISLVNRVARESRRFENLNVELGEISFWYKALVHEFLAFADGLGHILRSELSSLHEGLRRHGLGKKDMALLVDVGTHQPLTTVLPRTMRMLPLLFGVNYSLETGGANYRALRALVKSRETFTHPKKPGDVHPLRTLVVMHSAIEWFLRSWKELLMACASGFRQPTQESSGEGHFPFDDSKLEIAKQMEAEQNKEWGQLDFVQIVRAQFNLLTADTKRAFDVALDGAAAKVHLSRSLVHRNLIRFLFAEVEGMTFIAAQTLYRYGFYQVKPDKRLMIGEDKVVFERVVRTLRSFSEHFGLDLDVPVSIETHISFGESRKVRNRVIHPCSSADLKVRNVEMKSVFKLLDWWHGDAMQCFTITRGDAKLARLLDREEGGLREKDGEP